MVHQPQPAQDIINKFLVRSTWPIIKALFKEPFVKGVIGKEFFSPRTLSALISRISAISPDSRRQWGTMTPDQMLHHLNLATGSAFGYFTLPNESNVLSQTLFKWLMVDLLSIQPKGLQLPLNFKIPQSERFSFEEEKNLLLEIINKACNSISTVNWSPHPYFGKMTDNQWGRLLTVHIDYHLKQFGA